MDHEVPVNTSEQALIKQMMSKSIDDHADNGRRKELTSLFPPALSDSVCMITTTRTLILKLSNQMLKIVEQRKPTIHCGR